MNEGRATLGPLYNEQPPGRLGTIAGEAGRIAPASRFPKEAVIERIDWVHPEKAEQFYLKK